RPVFPVNRFTGFPGSHRFNPVLSGSEAVQWTNGSALCSGPVLCPVHGRTGQTVRSGS
ncbi:hypothetical protein A2U01_0063475, partial [Trifolium medium]|nr:hypothetical protein [Trifolium medium]